jgi:NTP pyrophosphatase (non-canonical NTP hydrolase)
MDLTAYQKKARKTAIYPMKTKIIYPTLGLLGEAGEVSEKVKKVLRDNNGVFSIEIKDQIIKELGDVLWYIANLASDLNATLNYVAEVNLEKLADRQARNKLQGSGDER